MNGPFRQALELILSGNREILGITATSLGLASFSTLFSAILGISFALILHLNSFTGRRFILIVLNGLMALPTVIIGLTIYSLVSRSGPLGAAGLLYTRRAIIIGQTVLAFPLVTSLVYSALAVDNGTLGETLKTLNIAGMKKLMIILDESKAPILLAVITGFGRVIGEVGVSMMLGGNIRWQTRTITTAIALETGKGEFEQALALGIILILLSLGVNTVLQLGVRNDD